MDLYSFWAKSEPLQTVLTHGIVSGRIAQQLLGQYVSAGTHRLLQEAFALDESGLRAFLGYLVSLHDIGKIEYSFQAKVPEVRRRMDEDREIVKGMFDAGVRHERTGQAALSTLWKDRRENADSRYLFSEVVGAHHQGKHGKGASPTSGKPYWTEARSAFEQEMRRVFLRDTARVLPCVREEIQGAAGALVLAIEILSDWIASGPVFAQAEDWIRQPDADEIITRKTAAFLADSTLLPTRFSWPDRFCSLWPGIPAGGMRPLQRETERLFENEAVKYRFVLLEAPMGEGKTEAGVFAALRLAEQWKKDGFYVALPTAATANGMIGRMREMLAQHGLNDKVRLLHGTAWLEQSSQVPAVSGEEADGAAAWLAPVRRGLLGQYAVGTVDQAMLAAVNVKYGALRLLGLSNKVLIIDEIHSYDAYMSEIIERLLEWCAALNIPVVMLSATLPPEKKQALFHPFISQPLSGGYPLITAMAADGTVFERHIEETAHTLRAECSLLPCLNDPEGIASAAVATVANGGCVCVLMNTVKQAQAVYAAIKEIYADDLLLFHAQFPLDRRAQIEAECLRRYGKEKTHRPARSILVATQVVEQSLDVDFDAMITAVAPIDLLIQRLGRVHRHAGSVRPKALRIPRLRVLIPADEKSFGSSAYVYPECLLRSSIRILRSRNEIRVPEDIAEMVQAGYSLEAAPPEELKNWLEMLTQAQVEAGASAQFVINPPDGTYNALEDTLLYDDDAGRVAASTRLGEPTVRLALADDGLMERIRPYLKRENGRSVAGIWRGDLAKEVMLRSVSLRKNRIGPVESDDTYIKGDKLLSGVWIVPMQNGCCRFANGTVLTDDPALGIIIKEGES